MDVLLVQEAKLCGLRGEEQLRSLLSMGMDYFKNKKAVVYNNVELQNIIH